MNLIQAKHQKRCVNKYQKNRYFYTTGAIPVHCGNAHGVKDDLQQRINRECLMGQIYIIALNVEKHLIGEINYAH